MHSLWRISVANRLTKKAAPRRSGVAAWVGPDRPIITVFLLFFSRLSLAPSSCGLLDIGRPRLAKPKRIGAKSVRIQLFTKTPHRGSDTAMVKHCTLDEHGNLVKDASRCWLSSGRVETLVVPIGHFPATFSQCGRDWLAVRPSFVLRPRPRHYAPRHQAVQPPA